MSSPIEFDQLEDKVFPTEAKPSISETETSIISLRHRKILLPVRKKPGPKAGAKFKKRDKSQKIPKKKRKPLRRFYQCDQCSETFNLKLNLHLHKIEEHGGYTFPCEICGFEFVSGERLSYHMKSEHNFKGRRKRVGPNQKRGVYKRRKVKEQDPNTPKVRRIHDHYECESCNFKCKAPSRIEQHLRGHETEEKAFNCDDCNIGFTTKQLFTFHQGQHQGHHKPKCDVCGEFVNSFELPAHMKTHADGDKIYPCSNCSQCFASIARLTRHIARNHQVESGKTINCDICGEGFSVKPELLEHIHDVHKAIEKVKCKFDGCNKAFFHLSSARLHHNIHSGRFTCIHCQKRFAAQNGLDAHVQRVHNVNPENVETFQCDQCPESFISSRRLQVHNMREHGAAKLACDICGKEFVSSEGLSDHRKKEHEGTGGKRCPVCDKKFPNPYQLRIHTEAWHSVSKNYVCEECGKAFRTLNKCNIHKLIHGEKKHHCSHCPKAFARSDNLVLHLRTHTGEKPYACDNCGRGFSQLGSKKTHQLKCSVIRPSSTSSRANEHDPCLAPADPVIDSLLNL